MATYSGLSVLGVPGFGYHAQASAPPSPPPPASSPAVYPSLWVEVGLRPWVEGITAVRGGLTVLLPGVGWRAIGVVGPTPVRASGRGVFAVPHVRARARTQPLVRGRAVLLLPGGRIMLAGILSWSPDRMNEEDALLGIRGDEDMLILLE